MKTMKTKTKLLIGFCVIVFLAFMGMLWHNDYQGTHQEIQTPEAPAVGGDIKG